MVFSSLTFLLAFLTVTLVLYYISPKKLKNVIILISGLLFYAWGEPIYVLAMILSTFIDYTAGRIMHRFDDKPAVRRVCLIVSIVMNLGLLGIFKYSNFLIGSFNDWFGLEVTNPFVTAYNALFGKLTGNIESLPLPIGISFFTFQSMSYTIDLYRRKIKVQKNAASFMAFVTLFPQIVAGPIVRYEDVQNEIDDRVITESMIAGGISRFITGLGKKVLIADNIGMLWTEVKAMEYTQLSAATAWLGILAFTFQIYFDFSGYSDMAIGLGKMMGFNFPENFNYPYMSKSISEFWRRWHMTLGEWFKSYVYFPLGGSKKGKARTIINLLIVWTITGIWHGAAWNFMFWGAYFGILIVLEKLFLGKWLEKIPKFFSWLYTFVLVVIGWVLFDAVAAGTLRFGEVFTQTGTYIAAMFGANGAFADKFAINAFVNYGIIFAVAIFGCTDSLKIIIEKIKAKTSQMPWSLIQYGYPIAQGAVMLASIAFITTSSYHPFLYFNF
ncbi:MAG: MBOAT family protein [Oscillospiraceae bacterium]|nr:MBOAT family protein [Oscillospiraceae bacterium]